MGRDHALRLLFVGLMVATPAAAPAPQPAAPSTAAVAVRTPLIIDTGARHWHFEVEVCRTPEQRMRGLQFRRSLSPQQGMLFLYAAPSVASMWMKDTYVALDMLFIDRSGIITRIAEHTEPLSEDTIHSPGPVQAVLELAAGTASRLGIAPGDRVRHAALGGPPP